jgi:hypothetical protein
LIINILIENQILDVELTSQDENDENISSIGLDLVAGVAEHEVDKEIDEAIEDCNSIKFSNRIHQKVVNDDSESININFDNLHNDSRKVSSLENLNIEIGGNQIIRYSCGNHKLNLALRHAISLHPEFLEILFNLNKSNSHIRNTIQLNKVSDSNF